MGEWNLRQDIGQAIRALRTQPGFAAAAIVMLGLGIGATTAIVSVVKRVLIDPLPYADAGALVRIVHDIGGIEQSYFNDGIALTYDGHRQAFDSVGVWSPSGMGAIVTGQGDPEEVRTLTASRGLFTTLGVQPTVGRWFSVDDDSPGSPDTVLISAGYWQRRFGADPRIVGRSLVIDGRPHQIIGVMPESFRFDGDADLMLLLHIDAARPIPFFYLNGIARMKPGVTVAEANADSARILEIYFDTFRVNTARAVRWQPLLVPLKDDVLGDIGQTLWLVLATVVAVLLMACANVATLLLVRGEGRRQEFAIRVALGAKWTRVARALLVESVLLALIGGALGLAIAAVGLRLLVAVEPAGLPRLPEIAIDPTVAVVALGISLSCGLLFGLMPIVKHCRPGAAVAIDGRARGVGLTPDRQRSQHGLVAVQMALAVVLLVAAGLMIRSVQALQRVEPGFIQPQTLQSFDLSIPESLVPDLDRVTRIQQGVVDRIAAIPGVASVAFTTRLPMDPSDRWSAALAAEDIPNDGRTPPNRQVKIVSPGSFATFGTPLVSGRDFTWTDLYELREVAIVSAGLATEMWGSAAAAVGKRIRQHYGPPGPWREIIGVVGDVHDDGVDLPAPATVYWPARLDAKVFEGYQPRRVSVVLRTDRAGAASLVGELHQAVWSVDRGLPLARVRTLDELYDRSLSRASFTLAVLAIAGGMALLLGICGVYGVVAYAVAQRRREIGIRMALGAQLGQIRALFVRRGLAVVGVGVLLGLGAAVAVTRLMESLLFGITPLDPIAFATMPLVLAVAAWLATYLPARRAMAVDPVETMRAE
jgi:predicted permease